MRWPSYGAERKTFSGRQLSPKQVEWHHQCTVDHSYYLRVVRRAHLTIVNALADPSEAIGAASNPPGDFFHPSTRRLTFRPASACTNFRLIPLARTAGGQSAPKLSAAAKLAKAKEVMNLAKAQATNTSARKVQISSALSHDHLPAMLAIRLSPSCAQQTEQEGGRHLSYVTQGGKEGLF